MEIDPLYNHSYLKKERANGDPTLVSWYVYLLQARSTSLPGGPVVGHTWSFFKDPVKLVEFGLSVFFPNFKALEFIPNRHYTNRSREPFSLQVIGRMFYIITAPEDVVAVYKATKALSFDGFLNEALRAFGVDKLSLKLAYHTPAPGDACYREHNPVNPKQRPFVHWIKELYRQALLPGKSMDHMAAQFHRYVDRSLEWQRISSFALQKTDKRGAIRISLKDFVRTTMIEAITDSLFGNTMMRVEPDIVRMAAEFNEQAWMLVHHYPAYLSGPVLGIRKKLMAAIDKYKRIPLEERRAGGEAWVIESTMIEQEILGMSRESNNAFLLLIYWA